MSRDAGDADLMAVGRHCANVDCRQIDFLPFPCARCGKVYCLQHRVCPCSEGNADTVLVCPLCACSVIVPPGEDVELAFDRHTRSECDPSNYDRVHRKPRCPVPGCKEKLTSTNTYTCRDCAITVCLKHRLPTDHKCAGKPAQPPQSRLGSLRRMFTGGGGGAAAASGSGAAAAARSTPQPQPRQQQQQAAVKPSVGQRVAAATSRATTSVQAQLQEYRQRQQRGSGGAQADAIDLTGSPAPAAAGSEVCPECSARFATVQQLIEHAAAAHQDGWASGAVGRPQRAAGGGGLERCPHCGATFGDPVQLVAHVEQAHGGGSSTNCVLC